MIHVGDCRDVMRGMAPESIDAVVTDPPYGLSFMGKGWDRGVPGTEFWVEALRVLKPGGHLLAFGGTRTQHRLVCAIEDAGFEIRDQIGWAYGSGFPKSLNLPGGLGTALKPAWEPICVARKPLSGTVAENVLRHGTGALNIDGCRIETNPEVDDPRLGGAGSWSTKSMARHVYEGGYAGKEVGSNPLGRWPANLIHDGSEEVVALFPDSKGQQGDVRGTEKSRTGGEGTNCYGEFGRVPAPKRGDSGSAARFFYCAKAGRAERGEGNNHPTVKPVALMRYLVRLVTPAGGTVLDPFAGSGTTGLAAQAEGLKYVLIEREPKYAEIAHRRLGTRSGRHWILDLIA